RLEEALEAELIEKITHLDRGGLEDRKVEILVWVEIENDVVGLADLGQRNAPIVDLERADLHQPEQARRVVDIEISLLALAAGDRNFFDGAAHALHGMALEEMLPFDSIGAAHQADRPSRHVWQHVGRNALVIASDLELGDADARIVDLAGVAQRDAGEG